MTLVDDSPQNEGMTPFSSILISAPQILLLLMSLLMTTIILHRLLLLALFNHFKSCDGSPLREGCCCCCSAAHLHRMWDVPPYVSNIIGQWLVDLLIESRQRGEECFEDYILQC